MLRTDYCAYLGRWFESWLSVGTIPMATRGSIPDGPRRVSPEPFKKQNRPRQHESRSRGRVHRFFLSLKSLESASSRSCLVAIHPLNSLLSSKSPEGFFVRSSFFYFFTSPSSLAAASV